MNSALQPVQSLNSQAETQPATQQAPKNEQAPPKAATPEDSVTISSSAKQALAANTKGAAGEGH